MKRVSQKLMCFVLIAWVSVYRVFNNSILFVSNLSTTSSYPHPLFSRLHNDYAPTTFEGDEEERGEGGGVATAGNAFLSVEGGGA